MSAPSPSPSPQPSKKKPKVTCTGSNENDDALMTNSTDSTTTNTAATATSTTQASSSTAPPNPNPNPNPKRTTKKKYRYNAQVEALQAEMEIATANTNHQGQRKRRMSRAQRKIRTTKRKILEQEDACDAVVQTVEEIRRLRGSKVAFEDSVLRGSLIFGGDDDDDDEETGGEEKGIDSDTAKQTREDNGKEGVLSGSDNEDDEEDMFLQSLGGDQNEDAIDLRTDDEDDGDDIEHYDDNDDDDNDDDDAGRYEMYNDDVNLDSDDDQDTNTNTKRTNNNTPNTTTTTTITTNNTNQKHTKKKRRPRKIQYNNTIPLSKLHPSASTDRRFTAPRIARTMYQLKNFQSHKMAQRHGDALGAHARGMHRTAVQKLRKLAGAAPVAPQVYSSLGLVYENMLGEEERRRWLGGERGGRLMDGGDDDDGDGDGDGDDHTKVETASQNPKHRTDAERIKYRLYLANKTYASYHIAAVLCKQDYTLWIRAGDAALAIASIHQKSLTLTPTFDDEMTNDNGNDGLGLDQEVLDQIMDTDNDDVFDPTGVDINDTFSDEDGNDETNNGEEQTRDEDDHQPTTTTPSKPSPPPTPLPPTPPPTPPPKQQPITTPAEYTTYHRIEKKKWLEEAKESYLAADNLHPPGITVPAKLAFAHMEVGNLIEALTILTDLKNNAQKIITKRKRENDDDCAAILNNDDDDADAKDKKRSIEALRRSELERSFPTWMLYADLMLRIGHECLQWNRGIETNDNYMFKRWLKKYANTFNWRERRLQALCMALEAAAGSQSCGEVMRWTRERGVRVVKASREEEEEIEEQSFWHVQDAYELDLRANKEEGKDGDDDLEGEKDDKNKEKEIEEPGGAEGKDCDLEEKEKHQEKENGAGTVEGGGKPIHTSCAEGNEINAATTELNNMNPSKPNHKSPLHKPKDKSQIKMIQTTIFKKEDDNNRLCYTSIIRPPLLPQTTETGEDLDSALNVLTETFNRQRDALLKENQLELADFDKIITDTTTDTDYNMGILEEELERVNRRDVIIERQKGAVVGLVGDFNEQKAKLDARFLLPDSDTNCPPTAPNNNDDDGPNNQRERGMAASPLLPLSASCATVIDIASQLLKLCLGMELYHGGKLVAEAVSSYIRERAVRHEIRTKRVESLDRKRIAHPSNSSMWMGKESYDDVNREASDASDDEDPRNIYLSDDEDFDSKSSIGVMQLMKRGILSPEIQVLYALSLIGEGGFDFLAEKLLQAINELEDDTKKQQNNENKSFLDRTNTNSNCKSEEDDETPWLLFRGSMIDPMEKTTAFAFVGDLLNKMGKENEWANRLQTLFEYQLNGIADGDDATLLLKRVEKESATHATKRTNYLKILLATLRMRLCKAQSIAVNSELEEIDDDISISETLAYEASSLALSIFNSVIRFQAALWYNASADGVQNGTTIEVLRILSGSFTIVMQGIHTFTSRSKNNLLSQCKKVISWICQVSIPNYDDINPTMPQTTFHESWQHFPVTSNWQNKIHSTISKRAYNLCVSCNVSAFSGWESDEFVMKLLKRRKRGQNHFGVHVKGEYVAGCLNSSAEVELLDQWKLMRVTLPNLSGLRFREGITKIEKENWHVASKAKMDDYGGCNDSIDVFGEGTALNILILFSRLCLIVAKKVEDEFREESLLKYALSIMLPLSQFALNQQLWDSPLGTEAAKEEVDVNDWEHFVAPPNVTYKPPVRQKQVKKYTRQSEGSSLTPKVHEESLFVKLVKVPTKVILQEWTGKEYFDDEDKDKKQHRRLNKWSEECSGSAKLAMKKVDYTIRKLRGCLTIHSLQKTSTQVALALLEVAPKNECKNPFLCLHQAAVFASHGSKGGNNDEIFKKPLPANHVCTPSEALSILGRADCLRALYFTNEAMFLCSYVAKVCCLHRDKKNSKLAWTPQWRVIGIYMYTVSLALDATIHSLTQGDARTAALKTWAKSVRKEIVRARCDAVAVNRAVAKKNLQNVRNEGPKDAGDKQVSDEYNGAYNGEEDESDSDYSDDDYYSEDEVVNNAMEGDKRCDLKEENEGTLAGTTADFMDESIEAPKSTVGIDDFIEGTKSGSPIKKESITKSGSPIIHESTKKPGSPIVIDILDDFIMGNCIIIPDSSEGSIDGDGLDASPDNPSGSESDSNVKVERL